MIVRTTLIGPAEPTLRQVEDSLGYLKGIAVERRVPYYPERTELVRLLRAVDPDVLFLSTEQPERMETVVQQTVESYPGVQIVLMDWAGRPDMFRRAMQLGVRECLTAPFRADDLRGAVERSMTRRQTQGQGSPPPSSSGLYSFLPAKPGVGASTIAVQTALSLPKSESNRGLLLDADIEAGMVRFMLQLQNRYSIVEALERVVELDEHLWPQLVSEVDKLDVLHAGEAGWDYRVELPRLQRMLEFARRHYSTICVDLPGAFTREAVAVMSESKAIFLVTTAEVASLHMARTRVRQLRELQLGHQVKLIVNRMEKKPLMTLGEIEKSVGLTVHATFANEYTAVQKSLLAAPLIPRSNTLGQQFATFAASLCPAPATITDAVPAPRRRRFLQSFSLPR